VFCQFIEENGRLIIELLCLGQVSHLGYALTFWTALSWQNLYNLDSPTSLPADVVIVFDLEYAIAVVKPELAAALNVPVFSSTPLDAQNNQADPGRHTAHMS
jgi:hypothetical protein